MRIAVLLAFASCSIASAARVRGASKRTSSGVVQLGGQLAIQLPANFSFNQREPTALLNVAVAEGTPAPEEAGDMSIVMSVDSNQQLHLHLTDFKAPAGWAVVGSANYMNSVKTNGWGYLSVHTSEDPKISDDLKAYAAGFLEGFSTAKQVKEFQHNANGLMAKDEANHQALDNIKSLFETEIATICKKAGLHANGTSPPAAGGSPDPFWQQAKFMLLQAWGLMDAYNQHVHKVNGQPFSLVELFILNSDGETPELEKAYDFQEVLLRQSNRECGGADCEDKDADSNTSLIQTQHKESMLQGARRHRMPNSGAELVARARARRRHFLENLDDKSWLNFRAHYGRCSALVRLAPDNSDIFVGHTTFSDYSEMNRIFKFYDLPLGDSASRRMGFASYPGVMGSTDDYYIMDTGLVVTETTVSMLSDEAFDKLDDNGTSVPDYMRIMIANRLSKSGEDWVDWMTKSATGTYNSQWMVVDYKLFEAGHKLQNGTLWVLEQAPGISHKEDMSQKLQKTGFWASENRGYFADIRAVDGENDAEEMHGKLFSANQNPRGNIFSDTAPHVATLADMRSEMQRNRWPHEVDGGPGNTPDHAIAARGDLDRDGPSPNGGVDSKVTNACLARALTADAICGPTHDGLPAFRWTDNVTGKDLYPDYPHDGLPDVWNFDWVRMTPGGELGPLPGDACKVSL